jgi:hypothetical protein
MVLVSQSAKDGERILKDQMRTSMSFLKSVGEIYLPNYDLGALKEFVKLSIEDEKVPYVVYTDKDQFSLTQSSKETKGKKDLLVLEEKILDSNKEIAG